MEYHTEREYRSAAESLQVACGMILFSFVNDKFGDKDIIIRNFIAKTSMTLKSIYALWEIRSYQDCWILYRSMLDRLFHLVSIGNNEEFDAFSDWSLLQEYKAYNKIKSDPKVKHQAVGYDFLDTDQVKQRLKLIYQNKPNWKRPKAEEVAKKMKMDFLYKYGYDLACMHVHPMANDGTQDFHTLTKIPEKKKIPSQITVLHNSILTSTIILQEAMNFSSLSWRKQVWDYIDSIRYFLSTGEAKYHVHFLELVDIFKTKPFGVPYD